jgi:hypothetical protein
VLRALGADALALREIIRPELLAGGRVLGRELRPFLGLPFVKMREFDGPDLGAVLLVLAAAMRKLVVVESALRAVGGAVEEIDRAPEELFEVGFKARVGERGDERIEDVGERRTNRPLLGQGARVGFVLARPVAVELEHRGYLTPMEFAAKFRDAADDRDRGPQRAVSPELGSSAPRPVAPAFDVARGAAERVAVSN